MISFPPILWCGGNHPQEYLAKFRWYSKYESRKIWSTLACCMQLWWLIFGFLVYWNFFSKTGSFWHNIIFLNIYISQNENFPQKNSQQKRFLSSSSILPGVMSSKVLFFCWNLQQKMQELSKWFLGFLNCQILKKK